jgi:hypothetical protein
MAMDDPLGIKTVSGFYGPGSWIAYTLALATSWVAVIRNDQSHNLHHIGYLLYVNWAAIDVIRLSFHKSLKEPDFSSEEVTVNGPLGAAFLVTWWGVAHTALQYAISYYAVDARKSRRRCALLELGILVPSAAGLLVNRIKPGQIVPALYWDRMNLSEDSMFDVPGFGICLFLMGNLMVPSKFAYRITRIGMFYLTMSLGAVLSMLPPFFSIVYSLVYIFHLVASGGAIWKKSCFFMPCAPQSLWDLDQAFTALVGVIMVVYELAPRIIAFSQRKLRQRRASSGSMRQMPHPIIGMELNELEGRQVDENATAGGQ